MVDVILIGIHPAARHEECLQQRADCGLLDVLQHPDDHLTPALNDAENGRLLLLQGTPPPGAFQPSPTPKTAFFSPRRGALYGQRPRTLHRTRPPPTGAAQADAPPRRYATARSSGARYPYSTLTRARSAGWKDSTPSGTGTKSRSQGLRMP